MITSGLTWGTSWPLPVAITNSALFDNCSFSSCIFCQSSPSSGVTLSSAGSRAMTLAWITPAVSGAIVKTNPGEAGDLRLHQIPVQIGSLVAVLEHDGWTAATARATDMEAIAADIHQLSRRMIES